MNIKKRVPYAVTHRSLWHLQRGCYNLPCKKKLLTVPELRGKTVLDIGSGRSPLVQKLRDKGIKAFSLDMHNVQPPNPGSHVRAYADENPFKKETFDVIYSSYSLFTYEDFIDIQVKALKEISRILKPGGKLRLAPIYNFENFKKVFEKAKVPMRITVKQEKKDLIELQKIKKPRK